MANSKKQFAHSEQHIESESTPNSNDSHAGDQVSHQMNKTHKPDNKLFNTRNAVIAVILMLILLLSLQAPICCDGVTTTELTLPAAVEQPERPAQLPPAPAKQPVAKSAVEPIASKPEAVITTPAIVEATAEPSKTELPEFQFQRSFVKNTKDLRSRKYLLPES